uniref:Transposon protein, putative, CACTA, En/Spm sub-class n=1 Tax=Oryza sativa subsp. japonica TaxID=39947 RepID=Q2QQU3_ORYSJ|nr:transposon protein, putative, CACTA, En/Spm sub-class [Oryza sativa Japonica Group]
MWSSFAALEVDLGDIDSKGQDDCAMTKKDKVFLDFCHHTNDGDFTNTCLMALKDEDESSEYPKCKNQKEYSASRTIYFHLFESGFMPSYNCWNSSPEEDEVEDDNIPDFPQYAGFEGNQTGEEERDADGNDVADDLGQMLQDAKEDCESCEQGHKKLDTTLEFLQWKAKNGVSDKSFGDLLKLVKNILPEGNKLPEITYEAKKIVGTLGLEVQKIHACPNYCILYRGEEYENLEACPVCKALRYKIRRDDPGEVDGQLTKKRIPAKWRNIDRKFKDFGKDARNIWFGLSTDGMNPFGEMSRGHSTWPVTMCIYNLPPWLCMKRKYIMMPIIIQGPKQPGNDIDVYLRQLVKDLKLLWKNEGVPVWDEDKQEEFNLRALLFATINDWPALSNLFGQSNKGYKACTHYMDETEIVTNNNFLTIRFFISSFTPETSDPTRWTPVGWMVFLTMNAGSPRSSLLLHSWLHCFLRFASGSNSLLELRQTIDDLFFFAKLTI